MNKKIIIIIAFVVIYFAFSFIRGAIKKNKVSDTTVKDEQILLDVRTLEETKDGILEDAINIPLDELESKLSTLDKNKEIMVYCRSGARATTAVDILTKNGYKAKNLGGYDSLKKKQ